MTTITPQTKAQNHNEPTIFAIFAGEFCASCMSMLGRDEAAVTLVGLELALLIASEFFATDSNSLFFSG
jgi:hypothetical protein